MTLFERGQLERRRLCIVAGPQHVGDVAPVVVPIFAVPCESGTKPVPPRHMRLPPQLPQLDSSEIVNLLGEMATKCDG